MWRSFASLRLCKYIVNFQWGSHWNRLNKNESENDHEIRGVSLALKHT